MPGCGKGKPNFGSGDQASQSGFTHQASQSGEGIQDIRQEIKALQRQQAKDRQTFEAPSFEGSVATFDGVPGAVIEGLPGGAGEGEVTSQADGASAKHSPTLITRPCGCWAA